MKKILKWGGIALVVIIILGAIAGSGDKNSSSQTANNGTQGSSSEEMTKSYSMNEDVRVGDVRWKVIKAEERSSLTNYAGTKQPQGKYVVVNVEVENLGKELKSVSDVKLVDDQDRVFTAASDTFNDLGAEQMFLLSNLNPNVPSTFAAVYEIPVDAKGLRLRVGDLELLGDDEAEIGLNL